MINGRYSLSSPTASLVLKAQKTLLPPANFYYRCQKIRKSQNLQRLYFLSPDPSLFDLHQTHVICTVQLFFDSLAHYVRRTTQVGHREIFYVQPALIRIGNQTQKRLIIRRYKNFRYPNKAVRQAIKIDVEIAGAGMIGRVAHVRVNDGRELAFKAFLDPNFVWQHGPWAEIPIGIYLRAHAVTKDLPQFLFAGQDWAVWEWIYADTKPQSRAGITYEQFARQSGLTQLNSLNRNNYNPYNMRLDFGGIQTEYRGRRFHDFCRGLVFYSRKVHREGLSSLKTYFTIRHVRYLVSRVLSGWLKRWLRSQKSHSI